MKENRERERERESRERDRGSESSRKKRTLDRTTTKHPVMSGPKTRARSDRGVAGSCREEIDEEFGWNQRGPSEFIKLRRYFP